MSMRYASGGMMQPSGCTKCGKEECDCWHCECGKLRHVWDDGSIDKKCAECIRDDDAAYEAAEARYDNPHMR